MNIREQLRYITDYLARNADEHPKKTAIIFEKEEISWSELWDEVVSRSAYFYEIGGDKHQKVIAILLTNSPEFVITYLSVVHAGHIALPLDPAYKKLELDAIVEEIRPTLVITDNIYKDQINGQNIPVLNYTDIKKQKRPFRLLRLSAGIQIASLTFTSGTTGKAKAVPHTHHSDIWNVEVCSEVWGWGTSDCLLLSLPLSHWYGIVMGLFGAIYHCNTVYLLDQRFDAPKMLDLLSSGKISFFSHTSVVFAKLLEYKAKEYDLSRMRLCVSGGSPLPPDIWKKFKKRFGVEIVETYGSSETGRIAANSLKEKVLGSPGKLLRGVEVKTTGSGEILVKSPGLFHGYYQNPEATKKSLTRDGWWHTGDLGLVENGHVYLKGRVQERIRRFGYTVSPRDVEWAMRKNEKILDIYVMGKQKSLEPNDQLIYFVKTKLSDKAILDYCNDNLIFAWRPDKIIRLNELPRTGSGKAEITKLRSLLGS